MAWLLLLRRNPQPAHRKPDSRSVQAIQSGCTAGQNGAGGFANPGEHGLGGGYTGKLSDIRGGQTGGFKDLTGMPISLGCSTWFWALQSIGGFVYMRALQCSAPIGLMTKFEAYMQITDAHASALRRGRW